MAPFESLPFGRLKKNITASLQGRDAFGVSIFMTKVKKDTPMIIKLTPDIERALAEAALNLGKTPEQLALDSLRERFVGREAPPSPAREPETLADFLCGHLGVLHSSEHVPGGARMSEASGKKFTAGLLAQRQQQRP
jgi:hypothetical protein